MASLVALLGCGLVALHGCGGFDPVVAPELRIHQVKLSAAVPRGIRVDWQTTDLATGRIDYGPTESATTTYITERAGIGLDADGHVMSEARTNGTLVGPEVNTVLDPVLRIDHSLVASQMTTVTSWSLIITSRNSLGQEAIFTATLPRGTSVLER